MLKILIVEDNNDKLRCIVKCLSSVRGISVEDIAFQPDAISAKRLLRENKYDLLIVDIAIPDRIDQPPSMDGGIRLLQEITERSGFRMPDHIIGLTGFAELHQAAQASFGAKSWRVIQYDPASDDWETQVRARAEHIVACRMSSNGLLPEFQSHLAVVCALDSPELQAVLRLDWNWAMHAVRGDSSIYYRGEIPQLGRKLIVYAAAASRMGMTATSILSSKMIQVFRPKYLAMVGIAAGIPGRTELGDVIAADPTWDYSSGKIERSPGETQARFQSAPHQISLSSTLRNHLRLLASDNQALARIAGEWPGKRSPTPLRLHIGPLASGPSVLADGEQRTAIIQQHRKLLGIEMETYALFAAAEEASEPRPMAFSLKSVCDFSDGSKNDDYQGYAAYTSAQMLRVFVERNLS